jgi:hypothetical protein
MSSPDLIHLQAAYSPKGIFLTPGFRGATLAVLEEEYGR